MKLNTLILISTILWACQENSASKKQSDTSIEFQNKGHELVYKMVQKVGDYNTLLSKKNVKYRYTYQRPDNKTDVSTEVYIFDGELSYGYYKQHERTFPQLEGTIEQAYDGKEYWLKHNGKILGDEKLLKGVAFKRPTNFYWFAMLQKLLDPGLIYEYLGAETIEGTEYDIVTVTFTSEDDKPSDIYQLYINKNTSLVDQFLFTVADFGKMDIPNLMQIEYEEIDGILIPTKRRYKKSTWNAAISEMPWINVIWSDIQFNADIDKEDFKKENNMKSKIEMSLKSK